MCVRVRAHARVPRGGGRTPRTRSHAPPGRGSDPPGVPDPPHSDPCPPGVGPPPPGGSDPPSGVVWACPPRGYPWLHTHLRVPPRLLGGFTEAKTQSLWWRSSSSRPYESSDIQWSRSVIREYRMDHCPPRLQTHLKLYLWSFLFTVTFYLVLSLDKKRKR